MKLPAAVVSLVMFLSHTLPAQVLEQNVVSGRAIQDYTHKTALRFEENKGQLANSKGEVQNDVLFTLKGEGMNVYFRKGGISYQWQYSEEVQDGPYEISEATGLPMNENGDAGLPDEFNKHKRVTLHAYQVEMKWQGANTEAVVVAEEPYADFSNYYYAHCAEGITHVKSYARITYKNMYPGIDVQYYIKDGHLKYDLLVAQGADLGAVKYTYTGATPELKNGKVSIKTPLGWLEEQQPVSWDVDGKRLDIRYSVQGNSIAFGKGTARKAFTIDPDLIWGTYYGGIADDEAESVATDAAGNVYLGGNALSNGIAVGTIVGLTDAFLAKFSPTGVRQWSTYYGGSGYESGTALTIDNSGNVYFGGSTGSSNFISFAGFQGIMGGTGDAFLVKFSSEGLRVWATYFGGEGGDGAKSLATDASGNIYMAGITGSETGLAFNGHKNNISNVDGPDAFLVKFSPNGARQWATYYGGPRTDDGNAVATDASGNVYLGGDTDSPSGIRTFGVDYLGSRDAYLVKFSTQGVRQWALYLGGTGVEEGNALATDGTGSIYLAGSTSSAVGIGAAGGFQTTGTGVGNDAFLAKFSTDGDREWATYYGTGGIANDDYGYATATDPAGNVYLGGGTISLTGIASGGQQNTYGGGTGDAFLVKFSSTGTRKWATYYGGTGFDTGYALATDAIGSTYLCGTTASATAISLGGHQNTNGGVKDGFLVRFYEPIEPSAQPTNLVFSNTTSTFLTLSFTAAAGSPSGYIAIRRAGAAPTTDPVDATAYATGDILGNGVVAYVGSAVSFNESKLDPGTGYSYKIYSYNGSGANIRYRLTSPLTNTTTTAAAPAPLDNYTFTQSTGTYSEITGNVLGTTSDDEKLYLISAAGQEFPSGGTAADTGFPIGFDFYFNGQVLDQFGAATNGLIKLGTGTFTMDVTPYGPLLNNDQSPAGSDNTIMPLSTDLIGTATSSMQYLTSGTAGSRVLTVQWKNFRRKAGSDLLNFQVKLYETSNKIEFVYGSFALSAISEVASVGFRGTSRNNYNLRRVTSGSQLWSTSIAGTALNSTCALLSSLVPPSGLTYSWVPTPPAEPTAQPTALNFPTVTSSAIGVSYTKASDNPTGYITVRGAGAAPTSDPVDGTAYVEGAALGDGIIAYVGDIDSFTQGGLVTGTTYHFKIYSYNGLGSTSNYRQASPLSGSQATVTLAAEPTAQPTAPGFVAVTSTSFTVNYTTASGTPAGYIAVRRAGAAPTTNPTDGIAYTQGAALGNGVIAYVGNATTFSETGLSPGITYFYKIYSYNGSGLTLNYRTTSPLNGNQATLALATEPTAQPTTLSFTNLTSTSFTVSYTAASGAPAGYIAVRRAGAAPTTTPVDGTAYTLAAALGDGVVAYVGSAVTFNETGLTASTTYHYKIYSYNGSGLTANYRTSSPLTDSQVTPAAPAPEPTAQPTALTFTSVAATSFTINYTAASGSPAGYIVVRRGGAAPTGTPANGTPYTPGAGLGDGVIAYVGSAVTFTESGLAAGTTYHYKIYSYNGSGATITYRSASPLSGSQATVSLAAEPTAQPTALTFSSVTSTSFTVSYTAASGGPAGYIVVRRTGAAPTADPVDGTAYALGATLGDGVITQVGSAVTFSESALAAGTTYHYRIYSYNGSAGTINYLQTSPLAGSQSTLGVASEPAAQPTALTFTSVTETAFTVSYTAAAGSPAGYLVIRKSGAASTAVPADGITYSTGSAIGDGTVAYTGTGTTFNETGLTGGTTYHYRIYSYNGSAGTINYLQTSPLAGSQATLGAVSEPAAQPSSLIFTSITETTFTVSYTAAAGNPAGYLVVRKSGSAPTTTPADGTTYAIGSTLGDGSIAYAGSLTTFNETGLTAGTTYHYRIFSYNGTGSNINYLLSSPLTGSQTTLGSLPAEPGAQPTNLTFSVVTSTSFAVNYTASAGVSGYIALRKTGSPTSIAPVDGTTYTLGSAIGDATVAYVGNATTFNQTGLVAGTAYHFAIFSFNGVGAGSNYRQVAPLTGSVTTTDVCTKPPVPTITATGLDTQSVTLTSSALQGNQWYLNGAVIAGATGQTLVVTGVGSYTVKATVAGCASDLSNPYVIVVTGVPDSKSQSEVKWYPNPASDKIVFDTPGPGTKSLHVFDGAGRSMDRIDFDAASVELNLVNYSEAVYYFMLLSENRLVKGKIYVVR